MDIRQWLQNPNAPLPGKTKAEKRYQANIKHESHLYELQDNQVYYKEYHDTCRNKILSARYTLYYNNAFEILTTIYEKLIYIGKYSLKATNFYTNYIIASNTAFEYIRQLWYSLSRNNYAWISAYYTYYNKEKAQKNNIGVIPI